ncbi:ATP6V0A1 [Cordylochernes scorpioides]|uniref:V-type proton ATPase subunit a n=1 Tax=Cordylochernes scorpioides TaxID=51811 RepID=A0ABY6LJD6_9ARAC|nr:ATP6V0A1 [Cordylochernes scorpioides]
MGALLRSSDMTLAQLYIQYEAAYSVVSELGERGGLIHFRDMNTNLPPMQRHFINEIRRCDDLGRILRYLESEIKSHELPLQPAPSRPVPAPAPKEMIDLEAYLEKKMQEIQEVNTNCNSLVSAQVELLEFKQILLKSSQLFEQDDLNLHYDDSAPLHLPTGSNNGTNNMGGKETHFMGYLCGVIQRERIPSFETILWRLSRGNAHFRDIEIEEPFPSTEDETDLVYKNVFIIFFQGENLKLKIKKVCEAFGMTIYPCPDNPEERRDLLDGLNVRIEDLSTVLNQTKDHQYRLLREISENLQENFLKVNKMKSIYHVLNMFSNDLTRKCLIGEGWIPTEDLALVQNTIEVATSKLGTSAPSILNPLKTRLQPPTYNKTNKFTQGYQNIVNAYGVGTYQEINPGLFTVISFPFIFSVMFGDAGHGLLMALAALFLVLKEKELKPIVKNNEIFRTFYDGRYIILLMGLFSVYTGMIYNDMFSLSTNIFGSSWTVKDIDYPLLQKEVTISLDPKYNFTGSPYAFGMDSVWQLSKNKILYLNSYKMKLSVILGVLQMIFGVVLSAFNHIHFKETYDILCEFIPQMIFLVGLFGYLVVLIVVKWFVYTSEQAHIAPSLLISFINMFMFNAEGPEIFPGQFGLQKGLISLAIVCIPWMLLAKPLYIWYKRKTSWNLMEEEEASSHHGDSGEAYSLGESMINQAIHTIEYCLGSISHTASYLRLWALSLAHSQLSEVLWTMIMRIALSSCTSYLGAVLIIPIFSVWAVLTLSILLLMEGLSAFLHAIRLHWVEFQSKFYIGTGYLFEPYTFKEIEEDYS